MHLSCTVTLFWDLVLKNEAPSIFINMIYKLRNWWHIFWKHYETFYYYSTNQRGRHGIITHCHSSLWCDRHIHSSWWYEYILCSNSYIFKISFVYYLKCYFWYVQYSKRHGMIHSDRCITCPSDTDISFALLNLFTYFPMHFGW
jgi:hypothetical protein